MYGYMHVHLHPNGHVRLSACIHQPVVIGFHSQAACLFWINTPKPHLGPLKCHASRRRTGGQWRHRARRRNHRHFWTHGLVLLLQSTSAKTNGRQSASNSWGCQTKEVIQFIWGFKALKRKECPLFALLGPSYFLCNTENYCKYYHLSVGPFSVASWLRQKHSVFLRTESPELLQRASL